MQTNTIIQLKHDNEYLAKRLKKLIDEREIFNPETANINNVI